MLSNTFIHISCFLFFGISERSRESVNSFIETTAYFYLFTTNYLGKSHPGCLKTSSKQ